PYLLVSPGENLYSDSPKEFKSLLDAQIQQIRAALDKQYVNTSDYPRDEATLGRMLGQLWYNLRDPWGTPYRAQFRIERGYDVLDIASCGPDQRAGTADDFSIGTIRRSYFAPIQRLVDRILSTQQDYPTAE